MVYDKALDDVVADMRKKKFQKNRGNMANRGNFRGRGRGGNYLNRPYNNSYSPRGNYRGRGNFRGHLNNNSHYVSRGNYRGRGQNFHNYNYSFKFNNNNNNNRGNYRGRGANLTFRSMVYNNRGSYRGRGGYMVRMPPTVPRHVAMRRTLVKTRNTGPMRPAGGIKTENLTNRKVNMPVQMHVSNLHFKVTEQDMEELFSEFGKIDKISLHYDREGKSQGSCDINFATKLDAIKALQKYNGVPLDGKAMDIRLVEAFKDKAPAVVPIALKPRPMMRNVRPVQRMVPVRPRPMRQMVPRAMPMRQKMLMKVRKSLSRANRVKNMGAKVSPKKPQPETEKDRKRMEEQLDKQLDAYLTEGAKSVF